MTQTRHEGPANGMQCESAAPRASRPLRRGVHALALAAALLAPAMQAAAQAGPDVVGLRFGMDEAQVRAALKAHVPNAFMMETKGSYRYRDGSAQHETPPYLSKLTAKVDSPREQIIVVFSSAPGPQRLVGVLREVALKDPPTQAQMLQQLTDKYGTPTVLNRGKSPGAAMQTSVVWGEAGKPMCWRDQPGTTVFPWDAGSELVNWLRHMQKKGIAPPDLSQCGYAVGAKIQGEPVHQLVVTMGDVGAQATSSLQAQQWVSELQKKAEQERLARGTGPKL